MATTTPIDRERLDALSASFSGAIIEPDDPRVTTRPAGCITA